MAPSIGGIEIHFAGANLRRPECVLRTRAGNLYVSDWRGGVTRIGPDGSQETFLAREGGFSPRPNGIALLPDGAFLLAHLGDGDGGVFRLDRAGRLEPLLTDVDGAPLPPTNFVHLGRDGRIWVTVSTRVHPRALDYRPDASSGFIALLDDKGARIAADGLGYANECAVDPSGEWLYVNETFARKLSRFKIGADGRLNGKETVTEFGEGVFPDGLAFAEDGSVWVASIVSNRVIRVAPDGTQTIVLEESDAEHIARVERAFQSGEMDRPHLDGNPGRLLRNISSMAFGGPNLSRAYLGCLLGDRIAWFETGARGHPPAYWDFE